MAEKNPELTKYKMFRNFMRNELGISKDGDRSQFFIKTMGRGDKFYEADAFLSMLRALWGITKAYDFLTQKPHEEKLLSIIEQVVEKGHVDRDFLEKYGGLKELERIETLTY